MAGGFLPHLVRAATATIPSAGSVHWLAGLVRPPAGAGGPHKTSAAGPLSMVGFDGSGQMAGRIDASIHTIVRTPNGSEFLVPWPRWEGGQTRLVVEVRSAATGASERTIEGHVLPANEATQMWEDLSFAVSRDGRFLAVLRPTRRMFGDPGTKQKPGNATWTATLGVEMIDLAGGRSLDYLELETMDGWAMGGHRIVIAPNGGRLYVFSRRFAGAFHDVTTIVDFDGVKLRVSRRVEDGIQGTHLPFLANSDDAVTPDGKTLARYNPPALQFVDLEQLTLVGQLDFPFDTSQDVKFPPRPLPLFTADGATLMLANPGDGRIQTVDLSRRRLTGEVQLPSSTGQSSLQRQRLTGLNRAISAISEDGSHLYVVENRDHLGGVWSVRLPGLEIDGRILGTSLATAVSVAPDGSTLAILSQAEARVFLLKPDGTLITKVDAGSAYTFAHRPQA